MPEIKRIDYANTRYALIEDPNPTYNRIFFDGQALDLNSLTPAWQKQFMMNAIGTMQYAGMDYTQANTLIAAPGQYTIASGAPSGTSNAFRDIQPNMTRASSSSYGITDQFPITDNGFLRLGYIQLQKGTVSSFAYSDGSTQAGATGTDFSNNTAGGQYDTFWHSLDFVNYPASKSWKSLITGYVHMLHMPYSFISANDSTPMAWFTYYPDIASGINNSSNNSAIITNYGSYLPTVFNYEDPIYGVMYGIRSVSRSNYKIYSYQNYNSGNTSGTYNLIMSAGTKRPFFIGTDNQGFTYWCLVQQAQTTYYDIIKVDPRTQYSQYVVQSNIPTLNNTYWYQNKWPSNLRRDSNTRYVFYSSHTDAGQQISPIRYVLDPTTGNVNTGGVNVAYPGFFNMTNYASAIAGSRENTIGPYGYNQTPSYDNAWCMKPWQFTSSGNNYITFWIVDQMAYPASGLVYSTTAATNYTTNGQIRWANTAQRTMLTYSFSSGNTDNLFTYHSSYTFPTLQDMPKAFMPINANNTLMAVVSYSKTNFFAWNNTTGWSSGGVYNQEFRMLGMDITNRIWGYAMDKNNGSIHILTPSLSVNVVINMAASSYTYTGTTISTSAAINAYDYTGSRIAANVTLTIDGTTMTFASNGLKTYNIQTSTSADTTVGLNIYGGGVNNIYAYA